MVNAGLAEDAAMLEATGADGIGLFRTEFQFLIAATLPGRESQLRLYRSVLEAAGDKPVVFRTVDIGGDKALPYLSEDEKDESENPAMGWRALRLSLERKALMKAQARALIEASAGKTLRVMFPMVSEPWEYEEARALFEEQIAWAKSAKRAGPKAVEFGAMLEVPSLAEMLDLLLPRVDFLSIGTNDLTQFLFAADRADPRLAERYDWLSPAILRFLRRVAVQARAADVPVRVCGEMAGRPLEAMALIGIGIDSFSITPAAVGPVKAMVRSIDAAAVRTQGRNTACQAAGKHAQVACRLGETSWRCDWLTASHHARLTGRARPPDNGRNIQAHECGGRADGRDGTGRGRNGRPAPSRSPRGQGPVDRGYRRPDPDSDAPPGEPGSGRMGQASSRDLFDRLRQELRRRGRARPQRDRRPVAGRNGRLPAGCRDSRSL